MHLLPTAVRHISLPGLAERGLRQALVAMVPQDVVDLPTPLCPITGHRFCLIPFKDQVYVPTLSEKDSWRRAGMGEDTGV